MSPELKDYLAAVRYQKRSWDERQVLPFASPKGLNQYLLSQNDSLSLSYSRLEGKSRIPTVLFPSNTS